MKGSIIAILAARIASQACSAVARDIERASTDETIPTILYMLGGALLGALLAGFTGAILGAIAGIVLKGLLQNREAVSV